MARGAPMASEDIAAFIADFRGAVRTVSRSCDRECHLDAPGEIPGEILGDPGKMHFFGILSGYQWGIDL